MIRKLVSRVIWDYQVEKSKLNVESLNNAFINNMTKIMIEKLVLKVSLFANI